MQTLKDLQKRIEERESLQAKRMDVFRKRMKRIHNLQAERARLLDEIGKLEKMAEVKEDALENEIRILREEVNSLRELLE